MIVATYAPDDRRPLHPPAADVEALAAVLSDADIGGFDVLVAVDQPPDRVARTVSRFFQDREADDLLLVYVACDELADGLPLTAALSGAVGRSGEGRIALLLDCAAVGAGLRERLGGAGRSVLVAPQGVVGDHPSAFSRALVQGLRTGDADLDLDGWVTLSELHAYVGDAVGGAQVWASGLEHDVQVARRGTPVTTPSELPAEVADRMRSSLVAEQEAAVTELRSMLTAGHPGRALAARLALERLGEHEDRLASAARAALAEVSPAPVRTAEPVVAAQVAPVPEPAAAVEPRMLIEPAAAPDDGPTIAAIPLAVGDGESPAEPVFLLAGTGERPAGESTSSPRRVAWLVTALVVVLVLAGMGYLALDLKST